MSFLRKSSQLSLCESFGLQWLSKRGGVAWIRGWFKKGEERGGGTASGGGWCWDFCVCMCLQFWRSFLKVLPGPARTEQTYIPAHPKGSGMEGERKGFAKLAWPECDTRTGNESLPAGQLLSAICIKRSTPRQGENDTRPPNLAWIKSAAHSARWPAGCSLAISPSLKNTPLSALSQPTEPHTFRVWILLKQCL